MHTHVTVPIEGDEHDKKAIKVLAAVKGFKTLGQFTKAAVQAFAPEVVEMAKNFRAGEDIYLQDGDK